MDLQLLGLTLRIAVVATLVNLPIALGISWLMVRRKVRGLIVIDVLVSLPLALPPVAIGFFLLLALGREGPAGAAVHALFGVDIVFSWIAAALASAVVSFPLMARAIIVAMNEVDPRLEMVARSLGAGPWKTFATVTVPLAYKGILAGALLGFVRALSEFGATITVAGNIPGQTQTLALAIYSEVLLGNDGTAMALIGVSVALAAITLAAHNWLLDRSKRRRET